MLVVACRPLVARRAAFAAAAATGSADPTSSSASIDTSLRHQYHSYSRIGGLDARIAELIGHKLDARDANMRRLQRRRSVQISAASHSAVMTSPPNPLKLAQTLRTVRAHDPVHAAARADAHRRCRYRASSIRAPPAAETLISRMLPMAPTLCVCL